MINYGNPTPCVMCGQEAGILVRVGLDLHVHAIDCGSRWTRMGFRARMARAGKARRGRPAPLPRAA